MKIEIETITYFEYLKKSSFFIVERMFDVKKYGFISEKRMEFQQIPFT